MTDPVSNVVGAGIGAGASLVGGFVNNLFARSSAKQQYKYQRKLNEQQFGYQQQLNATQQEYAQQNAHNDYMRQRELTRDSYSLSQIGKQDAGINLAFSDGSQAVASTNPTASPSASSASAGSAPTVQTFDTGIGGVGNVVQNYLQNMMQAKYQSEQINLLRSQTRTQQIENQTKLLRDIADLRKTIAETKDADERTRQFKMLNDLNDKYLEASMAAELDAKESEAFMKSVDKHYYESMTIAQLNDKLADIENKLADTSLKRQQRSNLIAEKLYIQHQIRKVDAETLNIKEDTKGKVLDNEFNEASIPYRLSEALNNATISDYRVIQEQMKTIPKDFEEYLRTYVADSFDRLRSGHGSKEDVKKVSSLISYFQYEKFGGEIRKWLSTFLDVLNSAKGLRLPSSPSGK